MGLPYRTRRPIATRCNPPDNTIERYIRRTVHAIVQLERSGGQRRIAAIVRPGLAEAA